MLRKKLILRHAGATLCVDVSFDAQANIGAFNTAMAVLFRHERAMKQSPSEAVCLLYGQAAENLYRLVFGQDTAQAILAFYGDDMPALVNNVHPFIKKAIVPAVQRASVRRRKEAAKVFAREQRKAVRA